MSIPRSNQSVNAPIDLDSLFDGDKRTTDKAERLAMTAAQMIRAAENRWQAEYGLDIVHQGGYGRCECIVPYADPGASPWVHLLPIGWTQGESGAAIRTYLVRGTGDQYGSPDWVESQLMYDIYQRHLDGQGAEWLNEYQQYIAENGFNDPLEDMQ